MKEDNPYNPYETFAKIDEYIDGKYTCPTNISEFKEKPFFDLFKPWRDKWIKILTKRIVEDFKAGKIKFIKKQ